MNMSRETGQDPCKAWKALLTERPRDVISTLIKGVITIFLVASVSLVVYLALSKQSPWFGCSDCEGLFQNSRDRSENFNISSEGYEQTNISHILFGIGGSFKTWKDRRHYVDLWWKPKITRGFVWLDEKPPENERWPETSPPYRVSEDSSRFKYTASHGSRSAVRIARIVAESFRQGLENVRWFVMGDDDTVFFTENLVSVLSKYDHRQMYYIGGNSESVEQNVIHSYSMAFGGGGFAISYPLAAQLVKVLDGCIDRYTNFYGSDQRIQACISEIGVPLTKELGFHQIDIRGEPFGLLAAHPVAPLVTLHHLDYVGPLFPNRNKIGSLRSLMGAYRVDPSRTLQRSICYEPKRKWSISVSWGYSAQIYPWVVSTKELDTAFQTFRTWRSWKNQPFTFNTRRLSPEPCERPVFYFLDRVMEMSRKGKTLTSYKRFVGEPGKDCDRPDYAPVLAVQSVQVLAPKMNPNVWKKAPRRQCCDIQKQRRGMEGFLRVSVRSCNPSEIVSPP